MKKILFALLIVFLLVRVASAQNRIEHNGQQLFINGINLAWVSMGYDLTNFNEATFTKAVDSMSNAGCNTMRWWLFANGIKSPQFSFGMVSGITQLELDNLKRALDIVMNRNMSVVLCLWSFDMLQKATGTSLVARNKTMLEDTSATGMFIRKALNPVLKEVGTHPAVLCWEVFNEPEGMSTEFGWTDGAKTAMANIQKFTNLVAGAIHRFDASIKVSNGAQTFRTCTDVDGYKNYYTNAELIKAGGDPLGTLDFYMVHYYTTNGAAFSPFTQPASHWNLDKPLVIGEFPAKAFPPGITPAQAYQWLYDNGYAGALSWTFTNTDGNGGLADALPGIQNLVTNHQADVKLVYTNTAPFIVTDIPTNSYPAGVKSIPGYANLKQIFSDKESGNNLTYDIFSISDTSIAQVNITNDSILNVSLMGKSGYSRIRIDAKDAGGLTVRDFFTVYAFDSTSANKSLFRKVTASTYENSLYVPEYVNDGKANTRWSSLYTDNQWVMVEMEKIYSIQEVILSWEVACAKSYQVMVSTDNINWTTVFSDTASKGGKDTIKFQSVDAKYVKVNCIKRATKYGFSLYLFDIYQLPISTGIARASLADAEALTIYPNPATDYIRLTTEAVRAEVYDLNGKMVLRNDHPGKMLDISQLKPGSYFIMMTTNANHPFTGRFIKQ